MKRFEAVDVSGDAECSPFFGPEVDDVVYVAKSVMKGEPVASVCLDEDGDWQFFALSDRNRARQGRPKISHFGHLLESDATLSSMPPLPINHWAMRDGIGAVWGVFAD
ncbi:hypothetical protein [Streptomyces sp. NPDC087437]|uniref:hypothetical protein n=1 Tax=Streptomyces sp. NPDC087437 TaxID=3365789 RepID=UPI003815AF8A